MGRLSRHLGMGLALPVLALTGCGVGTPQPDRDSTSASPPSAAAPSTPATPPAPSTPASPATPSPATTEDAVPISRAEQAALDEELRTATWDNDLDRATELIARGADVNAKDATEQSAYLITTSEGYLDLLNLTLAHGALIDDKDSWNGTGLIRAAERGHALVVGRLLQAGIDRDHVNRIGYQAIHEAVWLGADTSRYHDTIRALIAGGVDLTRRSSTEGLTPLQMAQQRGYPGIEAILRAALDPPDLTDPDAALLRAARTGDPDLAAHALRAGADIEARDSRQRSPLLLAAANDRVPVARLLVAMGADPDALDDRHDTPWLVTGVTGSVGDARGAAPRRSGPDHPQQVRRDVADPGQRTRARRLRGTGPADRDRRRPRQRPGLDRPARGRHPRRRRSRSPQIVRLLLAAGADPSIGDKDGVTALEHARARGYTAIARLLVDR